MGNLSVSSWCSTAPVALWAASKPEFPYRQRQNNNPLCQQLFCYAWGGNCDDWLRTLKNLSYLLWRNLDVCVASFRFALWRNWAGGLPGKVIIGQRLPGQNQGYLWILALGVQKSRKCWQAWFPLSPHPRCACGCHFSQVDFPVSSFLPRKVPAILNEEAPSLKLCVALTVSSQILSPTTITFRGFGGSVWQCRNFRGMQSLS